MNNLPNEHAFTVEAIDGDRRGGHLWTCRCGWTVTQRPGKPINNKLLGHVEAVRESERGS